MIKKTPKKRAIELFHRDSPFKPKVVALKKKYKRNPKHKKDKINQ